MEPQADLVRRRCPPAIRAAQVAQVPQVEHCQCRSRHSDSTPVPRESSAHICLEDQTVLVRGST